jgi:hypothetical protein
MSAEIIEKKRRKGKFVSPISESEERKRCKFLERNLRVFPKLASTFPFLFKYQDIHHAYTELNTDIQN